MILLLIILAARPPPPFHFCVTVSAAASGEHATRCLCAIYNVAMVWRDQSAAKVELRCSDNVKL